MEIKFKSSKKEHGTDAHLEFRLLDGGIEFLIHRDGTYHHGDAGDTTRAWFTISEARNIIKQLQELENAAD